VTGKLVVGQRQNPPEQVWLKQLALVVQACPSTQFGEHVESVVVVVVLVVVVVATHVPSSETL
jgi:hypothetical protein